MNNQEKLEYLISPEKFFPIDMPIGSLRGNKPFIDAAERYRDILFESQFWSQDQIVHIQIQRLKGLCTRISKRSLFWANYLSSCGIVPENISSLGDLTRLPILRRDELIKLGSKIYITPLQTELPLFNNYTSGTTGIPIKAVYSAREKIINQVPFSFRHPSIKGISLNQVLTRNSFVMLGLSGFRHLYEKDFFNYSFPLLQPSSLYNKEVREEIYSKIYEAAPTFLVGYSSLIASFAQVVAEDGIKLPLYAIRTTSEPICTIERELIKQTFNVPIVELLSNGAIGEVGFSCSQQEGFFHVNSETVVLEVIDENGMLLPEGSEGELVATSIAYTITPVIRYALNDVGRLISGKCLCGSNLPLFEFRGRRGQEIYLPSGLKIKMIYLYNKALMRDAGLGRLAKQFQIIQNRIDNILLLIVPRQKFNNEDEIKIRLAITELFCGEKINIEIKYVDLIPALNGGKLAFFVPLSSQDN